MKKYIYILLMSLVTLSCDELTVAPGPGPLVTAKDNVSNVENPEEIEIDFSNPAIIYGSDFGNFFQTLYIHNKYETMLSFTSSESIDNFGKDNVLKYYKNMEFGFELGELVSKTINDNDILTLNYLSDIDATKVKVEINIIVENDSCKVILPKEAIIFPIIKKNKG